MLFSYHYNFVFIHIPKTAGSSMRHVLARLCWRDPEWWAIWICRRFSHSSGGRVPTKIPRHAKIVAGMELLPADYFANAFKFAFVRNPWDLQVSSWHHMRRERPHVMKGIDDFSVFLKWKFGLPMGLPEVADRNVLRNYPASSVVPQSHYIIDLSGTIVTDFIGRFENLEEDFEHICRTIGVHPKRLPHMIRSENRTEYRRYYDPETVELVARHFSCDIERFGYTFE